jgi:type III secretory pathway component EscT
MIYFLVCNITACVNIVLCDSEILLVSQSVFYLNFLFATKPVKFYFILIVDVLIVASIMFILQYAQTHCPYAIWLMICGPWDSISFSRQTDATEWT